jgi:hypothetical protein
MVRELRKGPALHGLILANGGVVTHQHVICLSSKPRNHHSPYPAKNPLPALTTDWQVPPIEAQAHGEAIIEVRTFSFLPLPPIIHISSIEKKIKKG